MNVDDAYSNRFIFWKGRQKYFLSLALDNDKFLYENEYEAFDIIIIYRPFSLSRNKKKY